MPSLENTNRQALLHRGWYVATEIETAFAGLSGRAHDLLIIIKHLQGSQPDAIPSQQRLASIMRTSVRTVQRVLGELRRKGILILHRTGRASRYGVRYCRSTVQEIRVLLGGVVEIPGELVSADTTHPVASDTTRSGSPPYKEPPTEEQLPTPSLRDGGAGAAPARQPTEDEMSQEHVDELDPVAGLGLWDRQEPTDGCDGLFPAEAVASKPRRSQRRPRTQAQRDSAGALAYEIDAMVRRYPWAGPAPVNKAALARNLAAWRRDGLTADQIRGMAKRFCADDFPRRPGKVPWLDFINQRARLLSDTEREAKAEALETTRHDDEYFLGGVQQWAPESPEEEARLAQAWA